MESIFQELLKLIFQQPTPGMIALLILAVIGMGLSFLKRESIHSKERKEVIEQFQKQIEHDREELYKILERYQDGQLNVIQAMHEIKVLIATIGAKL